MGRSDDKSAERAADGLVAYFEQLILTGTLQDGDTLPSEREIVQEHNVSRTVVREAVLGLSSRGLIEARPRYRPVVRRPSYDAALSAVSSIVNFLLSQPGGVRTLFDTRIMVEVSLVRHAALYADKATLGLLKDALAANKDAIPNSELFYETDMTFHGVLYDVPGNPLLPSVHRAFTAWLSPHWERMPRSKERNLSNYNWHASMFEAMLLRDPDAAEAALRGHMDVAWKHVCDTFQELDTKGEGGIAG